MYWYNLRPLKLGHVLRYVEKRGNLLSSIVGMIAWVRPLLRHNTVETLGWWDKPIKKGNY